MLLILDKRLTSIYTSHSANQKVENAVLPDSRKARSERRVRSRTDQAFGINWSVGNECDHGVKRLIDQEYTCQPFYGSRKMVVHLVLRGHSVNRKRVQL
jgi:hypothetical protein